MDPLRPDQLLALLYEALKTWVGAQTGAKGEVFISRDPYQFLTLLAETPAGYRLVLGWDGDENQSDRAKLAMGANVCSQRLSLAISGNLGLTADPGKAAILDTAARPALLHLLESVRVHVRGLTLPDTISSILFDYRGTETVVTPDGIPLAAWKMSFEILLALTQPTYQPLIPTP